MRLFVEGEGSAGFALKGDDIVSVFSDGSSKGVAHSMLLLATQEGGRRLDAFNTVLPEIYAAHGFRTAAKLPWNDEFAPEDWSKETYAKYNAGEPDVVFMAHDPAFMGAADTDAVDYAPDYDAAVAAQQALLGRPVRAKRAGAGDGSRRDQGGSNPPRAGSPLEGAPKVKGAAGPNPRLVEVAEQYAHDRDITLLRQSGYVSACPQRAARIDELASRSRARPPGGSGYTRWLGGAGVGSALLDAGVVRPFNDGSDPRRATWAATSSRNQGVIEA